MAFARPAATEAPGPAPMHVPASLDTHRYRGTRSHEPHWRGRELRRFELHHRERRSQCGQWAAAGRNENEVRLPPCVRHGHRSRRRPHLDGSAVQHQGSRGAVRRQLVGERRPLGLVAPVTSGLRLSRLQNPCAKAVELHLAHAVAAAKRHVRRPQERASAKAERRTAAHGQRRRTSRHALQHRMRDRAATARLAPPHRRQAGRQRTRRAATQRLAHPQVEPPQLRVRRRQPVREPRRKHQQPRHRRGRLGVARVGLDADQRQRRLRLATRLQQRRLQRARLNRVAQRRARAVRLQPRHARRGHAGLGQRRLQQRALRRAVGRRQARAPPVLPHRTPAQHHRRSRRGPRRQLQHRRAARLAAHVAVRAGVEGVAPPSRRRHSRHREREADGRGEHEVDRREQRVLALAQLHCSPRGVASNKRRRAGGVIRAAWPLQPQHVRQPARRDGVAATRRGVHAAARRARLEHLGEVVRGDAEEHARRAAHELGSPQPGRVERLVPPLKQQPLLRVHRARLRRRHAEAPVVKPLGAKHERAVPRPQRH
eukprot:scaffold3961_cov66-Phaeocystis_antarctica.AAC.5